MQRYPGGPNNTPARRIPLAPLCYQISQNRRRLGHLLPQAGSSARQVGRGQVPPQNARVRLLPPAHLFRGSTESLRRNPDLWQPYPTALEIGNPAADRGSPRALTRVRRQRQPLQTRWSVKSRRLAVRPGHARRRLRRVVALITVDFIPALPCEGDESKDVVGQSEEAGTACHLRQPADQQTV
jgi:hypothetical protein